ncbi:MAG: hypothetical protein QM756_34935 [Polyangiaceae bacterium]
MPRQKDVTNEGASGAFVADAARRASAARAIAAVFGALTFMGSFPPLILGKAQASALVQLAAAIALFVISVARQDARQRDEHGAGRRARRDAAGDDLGDHGRARRGRRKHFRRWWR